VLAFNGQDFLDPEVRDVLLHGQSLTNPSGDAIETHYFDQYGNGKTINPFQTKSPNRTEIQEMIDSMAHEQGKLGIPGRTAHYDPTSYNYIDRTDPATGKTSIWIQPDDDEAMEEGTFAYTAAAPLSDVPTATTNVNRPRTVAAGYSTVKAKGSLHSGGKLTVVFRDGTYYNYYNVDPETWEAFKAAPSKGVFIRTVLDFYPRGEASTANLDPTLRQAIYSTIRSQQWQRSKGRKYVKPRSKTQRKRKTKSQRGVRMPVRAPR
jgi:hypothetical protein